MTEHLWKVHPLWSAKQKADQNVQGNEFKVPYLRLTDEEYDAVVEEVKKETGGHVVLDGNGYLLFRGQRTIREGAPVPGEEPEGSEDDVPF